MDRVPDPEQAFRQKDFLNCVELIDRYDRAISAGSVPARIWFGNQFLA
jgi:hypothetical protein